LELVQGANCSQASALRESVAAQQKSKQVPAYVAAEITASSLGVLRNLKSEIEQGIIGNLRCEVTGEVLGDLLQLGKATLGEGTNESKHVAAVLVAAAFEDTIRRLGLIYCGIQTREGLPDILVKLKKAEIFKGSQVGVVQSHFQSGMTQCTPIGARSMSSEFGR
jgi:hypothetical protein